MLFVNLCRPNGPAYGLQWLKDHNAAAMKANKAIIVEELGVNRTAPEISVQQVLDMYQEYILGSEAIQGSLDWSSLYVVCTTFPAITLPQPRSNFSVLLMALAVTPSPFKEGVMR